MSQTTVYNYPEEDLLFTSYTADHPTFQDCFRQFHRQRAVTGLGYSGRHLYKTNHNVVAALHQFHPGASNAEGYVCLHAGGLHCPLRLDDLVQKFPELYRWLLRRPAEVRLLTIVGEIVTSDRFQTHIRPLIIGPPELMTWYLKQCRDTFIRKLRWLFERKTLTSIRITDLAGALLTQSDSLEEALPILLQHEICEEAACSTQCLWIEVRDKLKIEV